MSLALVWFRRDLRLHDNPALHHACARHDTVIPVYIHSPEEEAPWEPGAASRWWLHRSLEAFELTLRSMGSRLIMRQGGSLAALETLLRETNAEAVYWNRLYEPAITARDQRIKAALRERGLHVASFNAALLVEPWTLQKDDGAAYKVFTPFWKAVLRRLPPPSPLPAPATLKAPNHTGLATLPLEALALLPRIRWYSELDAAWRPGEAGALARLRHFRDRVLNNYHDTRNRVDQDGVSRLSPHLHCGEISPRQIWAAVRTRVGDDPLHHKAAETYLREIGWREFAHYVLFHWPHTPDQPMQERFAAYPWRGDFTALLQAWREGRTGYPLIDAGMRELWRTGWMHNRARMVVASFLTKNCRIPWQTGERWFWDTLVDADLANNTLGWQWTAGCGTDAAPYFRVFNPLRQSEQFDPEGVYLRRWLPELAPLPLPWPHRPWATPEPVRRATGFQPGSTYPAPSVDLAISRAEALAGYARIRDLAGPS